MDINDSFDNGSQNERENAHHRAICGSNTDAKTLFARNSLISLLIENPVIWVVDFSASYVDLFEMLEEEERTWEPLNHSIFKKIQIEHNRLARVNQCDSWENPRFPGTAVMRVSRSDSDFTFNPFLLDDPYLNVPEEQFEFCMDFLKMLTGLAGSVAEPALREGLKMFFGAYQLFLRNQKEDKYIQPLTLLSEILEMKIRNSDLAAAVKRWTGGRRGKIFNSGSEKFKSARYCCFDLRDIEDDQELKTAILYMIFAKAYSDIAENPLLYAKKCLVLDESHRYIANPALSSWIQKLTGSGIMLDLITESINDLATSDILKNLNHAFFFPGQNDIDDSFRKLGMTGYHVEQYKKLDPAHGEIYHWTAEGVRRTLRFSVIDPYTYWLITVDAKEREMKRYMKGRFGNIHDAVAELVRITADCKTVEERLSKLSSLRPKI